MDDLGSAACEDVQLVRRGGVGVEVVLHLSGPGHGLVSRQLEQPQLPVVLAHLAGLVTRFGVHREEAREHVAVGGVEDERTRQREARGVLARHPQGQVVRRLLHGLGAAGDRVVRDPPEVPAGVEGARVGHVVPGEQFALHLEHVERVAQVAHEAARDLGDRLERCGEDLIPRLQHRVLRVPRIQGDRPVVGVDDRLDRVADVVDLVRLGLGHRAHPGAPLRRERVGHRGGELLPRGVGVVVRGGVPVDHPDDLVLPAVLGVDDRRIDLAVERQVRGDRGDPRDRVPVVEDLRFTRHPVGEQELGGAHPRGEHELVPQVAHRRAAVAGVGGQHLPVRCVVVGIVQLPRVGALGCADDRVLGGLRREVDARLIRGQRTVGGDAALEELRVAVVGHRVPVGGDHAEAVGEHSVVVHPAPLAAGGQVELTDGDHGVGLVRVVVECVPVDGELVRELVVLLVLLELTERRRDDRRVEQADRGGRFGVLAQLSLLRLGARGVRFDLDAVEAVGIAGRIDVALDELLLEHLRVRVDPDRLDERRVDPADHDRRDDHERDADRGQLPAAAGAGVEEQHRHEHADDGEDRLRGQHRVDVGVRGAVEPVALLGQERVAVEPVVRGDEEREHTREHGDVDAGGPRDPLALAADGQAAVQVVREHGHERAEERDRHEECDDHPQRGQREQVEGDVDPELGVGLTEGLAVECHEHGLPLPRDRRAGEEAREHRGHEEDEPAYRVEGLPIPVEVVLLRGHRHVHGPVLVGQVQVEPDEHARDAAGENEQDRLGDPLRAQHFDEAQLVEPEPFGPEARQHEEQDDDSDDDPDRGDQGATGTLGGGVGGVTHGLDTSGASGTARSGAAGAAGAEQCSWGSFAQLSEPGSMEP